MERASSEPEHGAPGTVGLRLEVHVVEAVVGAGEGGGRVPPEHLPGGEMLVEKSAAGSPGNAEGLVLRLVPAHDRLDDEPSLGEQVERRKLLREQQWVPERHDDRSGDQPQPSGRRGDRAEQYHRAGPGSRRILVSRERVVARVGHQAVGVGARAEHHVLAEHDRVETRLLRLDRHPDEGAQVVRRSQRPVLAEDEDELGCGHVEDLRGVCRRCTRGGASVLGEALTHSKPAAWSTTMTAPAALFGHGKCS